MVSTTDLPVLLSVPLLLVKKSKIDKLNPNGCNCNIFYTRLHFWWVHLYLAVCIIVIFIVKYNRAISLIVTVSGLLVCTRAEAARRWTCDVDTRAGVWIMPLISHWSASTACVCPRSFCASVIKKQAHRIWWLSSITRGCSLQLWKARISVLFCYGQISQLIFSETKWGEGCILFYKVCFKRKLQICYSDGNFQKKKVVDKKLYY